MTELAQYALLGLGVGGIYALAGQGIVVTYRGSAVLNFAYGALALLAAWVFYRLWFDWHWPIGIAIVCGVAASTAVALAFQVAVLRPLRDASQLVRVVATLGLLAALQQLVILLFGSALRRYPTFLPSGRWNPAEGLSIGFDRLVLLGIAAAVTLGLHLLYRFSRFGLATRAAAENRRAASALGVSPDVVGGANWALGGALAGLAGILVTTISGINLETLTLLVLPALAAALVGGFQSFPLTFLAAVGIGVGQSVVTRYVSSPGWSEALPFLVIVVVLAVRGSALPSRADVAQHLPRVGRAGPRPLVFAVLTVGLLALVWLSGPGWVPHLTITFAYAMVALSLVVLTGYAGQVSLGQFALAAIGAFGAARVSYSLDWPFLACLAVGIVVGAGTGLLFALPALRTRGVSLAVVTVGLALAVDRVVLGNQSYVGGPAGTPVDAPRLLGWPIDALNHPRRYASVVAIAFLVLAFVAMTVRTGPIGRKLIAVRGNERAAAALGIRVAGIKFVAFGLSAAMAAVAGVFLAFREGTVRYEQFDVMLSINVVVWALIGGIGYVHGSALAALLAPGTLMIYLLSGIGNLERYLVLLGGVLLMITLIANPNGLAYQNVHLAEQLRQRLTRRHEGPAPGGAPAPPPAVRTAAVEKVRATTLDAREVTVRFGNVVAVDRLSLTIAPGRITGLIGANGAGKTTFIDAVTGYAPLARGALYLDGERIDHWSPDRRARAGLARSFQSLELLDDLTVEENLLIASDRLRWWQWAPGLVRARKDVLPPESEQLVDQLGLRAHLQSRPGDLSFGARRLLAVARTAASRAPVLLFDEPAAGLDDRETEELGRVLRWLADEWGAAILLVEHHVQLVVSVSDEIVAIDFGRPIFSGSPLDAVANADVRAAYLGVPEEVA